MKRRSFIRNTTLGAVAFSGLNGYPDISAMENKIFSPSKPADNFWLWGQNPGSHHVNQVNLPGVNHMDSREGCDFFGMNKCCRVTMPAGPFPPFDKEAEKLEDLKELVWSAIGAGGVKQHDNDQSDLDEVLRIAEIYSNITGAILDDFFYNAEDKNHGVARHSIESIRKMRDKLHSFSKRRLDLWVVWYTQQLDLNVGNYLDLCDVITMWTWKGRDLSELDTNIQKCIEKTQNKRRLIGCYMWNYGEKKPLTMAQMKYQLDKYYHFLKKGYIEGIIFCSNCIADIGLDTVEYTRKWIAEVGNEEI